MAVVTKKDASFEPKVILDRQINYYIRSILQNDIKFLYEHNLMDYSVLLGTKKEIFSLPIIPKVSEYGLIINEWFFSNSIAFHTQYSSYVEGPCQFYLAIIDYLQKYTWKKKLERFWKCFFLRAPWDEISDVPPAYYRDRMQTNVISHVWIKLLGLQIAV